jgi:hypothetical protein
VTTATERGGSWPTPVKKRMPPASGLAAAGWSLSRSSHVPASVAVGCTTPVSVPRMEGAMLGTSSVAEQNWTMKNTFIHNWSWHILEQTK